MLYITRLILILLLTSCSVNHKLINSMGDCTVENISRINETTNEVTLCNSEYCLIIPMPYDTIIKKGMVVVPKSCKTVSYLRKPN